MTLLDIKTHQKIDSTYRSFRKNQEIYSWIDHVGAEESNKNINNVKTLLSDKNLSDHNAISLIYELIESTRHIPITQKKQKI